MVEKEREDGPPSRFAFCPLKVDSTSTRSNVDRRARLRVHFRQKSFSPGAFRGGEGLIQAALPLILHSVRGPNMSGLLPGWDAVPDPDGGGGEYYWNKVRDAAQSSVEPAHPCLGIAALSC